MKVLYWHVDTSQHLRLKSTFVPDQSFPFLINEDINFQGWKRGNRDEKESRRMTIIISHMRLFIVTKLSLISLFPFSQWAGEAKNVNADSLSVGVAKLSS